MRREFCANVLVVDDDEHTASTLCLLLRAEGHECTVATTGADAIAKCDGGSFDCMLLDVQLGRASGMAVAERLVGKPYRPNHIILMTGHPRSDFAAALRSGLVDGHLLKPADMFELADLIRRSMVRVS